MNFSYGDLIPEKLDNRKWEFGMMFDTGKVFIKLCDSKKEAEEYEELFTSKCKNRILFSFVRVSKDKR